MPALLDSRSWQRAKDNAIGTDVWFLKKSGNACRIMNPKPEMIEKIKAELANCPGGRDHDKFGPKHMTTSIFPDGSIYTYHCRSFSRWLSTTTGEMEGSPHCTCDGCF